MHTQVLETEFRRGLLASGPVVANLVASLASSDKQTVRSQTVTAIYKTVTAIYKRVAARYKRVTAKYKTITVIYKTGTARARWSPTWSRPSPPLTSRRYAAITYKTVTAR